MKYIVILFFSLQFLSISAYAQENRKHKVAKGETVLTIAKNYKVTPYDIYRLNPDAKNGLKTDSVLLIPVNPVKPLPASTPVADVPTKVVNKVHPVTAGETLFSISKQYKVTVADLEKANADAAKAGLKIGQELIIPVKGSGVAAQVKTAEKQQAKKGEPSYMFYTVAAGDTKYSIAKKYGMTVQLIEELNPAVKDTLPLGFKLKLAKDAVIAQAAEPEPAPASSNTAAANAQYSDHVILAKETMYSLTKASGLTEQELLALNPSLKDGVKAGMTIKVPSTAIFSVAEMSNLSLTLDKSQSRELALLLPFNLYRLESDTVKSKLLRTDKFLNLTLDFYAGAMIAIDSARALGLPLKVKILDAKENSKTSDVAALKNGLVSTNAIIGPFFQGNAESTAALLPNVPVISPMAKDGGKPYSNLYLSIPSDENMRLAMLNYLKSKGGNVIAIVDKKKTSSKDFIQANFPEVRFLDGITGDGIRALLVKDKTNYVILDTEALSSVTGVTKLLNEAQSEYTIELAVLDKTEKLEHDEVPLDRLIKLKMLYPSITRDDDNPQSLLFNKIFREKNGYNPSQYAVRGFDVTFDVIMRLFQPEGFIAGMETKWSAQVENKFTYVTTNGGNYNTGVYIMQYNEGPTIKEAQ